MDCLFLSICSGSSRSWSSTKKWLDASPGPGLQAHGRKGHFPPRRARTGTQGPVSRGSYENGIRTAIAELQDVGLWPSS